MLRRLRNYIDNYSWCKTGVSILSITDSMIAVEYYVYDRVERRWFSKSLNRLGWAGELDACIESVGHALSSEEQLPQHAPVLVYIPNSWAYHVDFLCPPEKSHDNSFIEWFCRKEFNIGNDFIIRSSATRNSGKVYVTAYKRKNLDDLLKCLRSRDVEFVLPHIMSYQALYVGEPRLVLSIYDEEWACIGLDAENEVFYYRANSFGCVEDIQLRRMLIELMRSYYFYEGIYENIKISVVQDKVSVDKIIGIAESLSFNKEVNYFSPTDSVFKKNFSEYIRVGII